MIMSMSVLQTETVSLVIPQAAATYIQAFIVALVYGFYGYFSGTGGGLPVQWNTRLIAKTVFLALLVAYAETQLGLTGESAQTWAQGTLNLLIGVIASDKAVNGMLNAAANKVTETSQQEPASHAG